MGAAGALAAAGSEHDSGSCCIKRTSAPGEPYASEAFVAPLKSVAKVPPPAPSDPMPTPSVIGGQRSAVCPSQPITARLGSWLDGIDRALTV